LSSKCEVNKINKQEIIRELTEHKEELDKHQQETESKFIGQQQQINDNTKQLGEVDRKIDTRITAYERESDQRRAIDREETKNQIQNLILNL